MRAVGTKRRFRRWAKLGVLAAAMAVTSLALRASPVAADQPVPCPDGFVQAPAAAVPSGAQKDKNGNGLVCVKWKDSKIVGGPDDDTIVS
jgi:hypothetical protein